MTFSLTAQSTLSTAGDLHLAPSGGVIAGSSSAHRAASRPRADSKRRGLRRAAHLVLADLGFLWAWAADDAYAAPTRHATVESWMEANPASSMQLWLSANVVGSSGARALGAHTTCLHARAEVLGTQNAPASPRQVAAWQQAQGHHLDTLDGIGLDMVRLHARRHAVEVQSVATWWSHALVEAERCVPALLTGGVRQVCVVEGRCVGWISWENGAARDFRQVTLEASTVGALQAAIEARHAERGHVDTLTVALGHGLYDGHKTEALDAHVLGRLDGQQPPHWLRPGAITMM